MNFKILILFFLITSCGVKAPPVADSKYNIPSIVNTVSDQLIQSELNELESETEQNNSTQKSSK